MFRAHVLIVRRAKLYYTVSGIIKLIGGRPVHRTATYRCNDTRDCVIQFCPPDDEHMCSKHEEAWNKLIKKFSASSWLILTLILLMWRIWWAPNNVSKWQMGFNSAFKGLINKYIEMHGQQNIEKITHGRSAFQVWNTVSCVFLLHLVHSVAC